MHKLFQFLYYRSVAKKIKSSTIKANSQDSFNDCIKTIVVLAAVIVLKIWNINLDAWFGLAVSIYIIINGIKLVKEASSPLIGEKPSSDLISAITDKIMGYEGVLGYHDLVIHNYGPGKTFITVHVEVDSDGDILESHDMIDNIERDFMTDLNLSVTIHMDPIQVNDPLTNELQECTLSVLMEINPSVKFHDFRIVKGSTHINVLFDIVVPHKNKLTDEEILRELIKVLKEEYEKITNIEVNIIINIDKEYV